MTAPLRVIAVDDEPFALFRLSMLLAEADKVELVATSEDGLAAIELANRHHPDVCLVDVDMPGLDGIATARLLSESAHPPAIIFITAYDQYAVAAFETEAIDYLLKPVSPERLKQALDRVRQRRTRGPARPVERTIRGEFWVAENGSILRVDAGLVDCLTAERDYVRLHSRDRTWLINDSMLNLEKSLDPLQFIRIHRSTIVRRDSIAAMRRLENGWVITLSDGSHHNVGRLYADAVRELKHRR